VGRRSTIALVAAAVVTAVAAFGVTAHVEPTLAWTNTRTLSTTVAAVPTTPPTAIVCTPPSGTVNSMTMTWTPPASGRTPTGYLVTFNGGFQQNVTTPSYTVSAGLLSLPATYTVAVRAYYGSTTWVSAAATKTVNITGIGVLVFTFTCA
jgi:hypothetical protein